MHHKLWSFLFHRRSEGDAGPGLMDLLRHIRPELREHRGRIAFAVIALLAEIGMRLLEPWPIKLVFDYVLSKGSQRADWLVNWFAGWSPIAVLSAAALALLGFAAFRALAAYWNTIGFAIVGVRVLTAVRARVFRHLHLLPLSFHNRARSGDLVVRVISDVSMLQDVIVTALLPLTARLLVLLGMVGVMFWMDWRLALLSLSLFPLFWLRTVRLSRDLRVVAREQRRREGAMAATAAESLSAMKVVQALSAADSFTVSFSNQNQKSLSQDVKGKRLAANLERSVDVLIAGSTALVLWQGARFVLAGTLSAGDLLVFMAYLKSAFRPVQDFAKFTSRLGKASAAGARVIEMLEAAPATSDRPNAVSAAGIQGQVRFEGVGFGYDRGGSVFEDLTLSFTAGETVAIIGPSGSGKTTVLGLLLRLHDARTGRILIDGRDIREYQVESLRRVFGVVLQENLLFSGTVRENITLGWSDATQEEVEAAARLANAHEFILQLTEGYETIVGERGTTLSQGQRQRIAIARTAIRKPSLLLYDEPTTGLDEESERSVIEGLRRLSRGHTTFWATHNLRHTFDADKVVMIESGNIVECGSPTELLRKGGRYAALRGGRTLESEVRRALAC